jgi:hypothetical protein
MALNDKLALEAKLAAFGVSTMKERVIYGQLTMNDILFGISILLLVLANALSVYWGK